MTHAPDSGEVTRFGFTWGPMSVERCMTLSRPNGEARVVSVIAGGKTLHVYVSPTGRSVRVFDDFRGEWKPGPSQDSNPSLAQQETHRASVDPDALGEPADAPSSPSGASAANLQDGAA